MSKDLGELPALLQNLEQGGVFHDVLAWIDARYDFTPTAFRNGDAYNAAGENNGSCRVFACAQLHDLSVEDTLALFAEHYAAVLATPHGLDHANIRNFMAHGWNGIAFEGMPLQLKV